MAGLAAAALFALSWRTSGAEHLPDAEEAPATPDSIRHTYLQPELRALVDSAANFITDSTASLAPFFEKLEALQTGDAGTVSVLHIGDSHVQAGYMTGRVRTLFQNDFGNAGRGLITPHKMAKMNEAPDYAITTPYGYKSVKVTDKQEDKPGFTGVAVTFETPYNELKIWSKTPFNGITIHHSPGAPVLFEPDTLNIGSYCDMDNTPTSTRISLSHETDSLTLRGFIATQYNDPTFYGFSLESGLPGVVYHSLGVNGAAFEHFVSNSTLADGGAAALCPDIIIVSLGTNNCYGGNFQRGQLYNTVDDFIRRMKRAYPGVPILMTSPMESCRRQGGRRVPNPNIVAAVEVICSASVDNDVAFWNFYDAAGGAKAMERWAGKRLANADRIHLTESGYALQGDMLYEAIARHYNTFINRDNHGGSTGADVAVGR